MTIGKPVSNWKEFHRIAQDKLKSQELMTTREKKQRERGLNMLFKNEFAFLSNMYPCIIEDKNGRTWLCAESAYQACKSKQYNEFIHLNGYEAKKLAKQLPLRDDWDLVKLNLMEAIVLAKFSQNASLRVKLLSTKGLIQEDNTWGDTYWGVCKGRGENHLGLILMHIRDHHLCLE